MRLLYVIFFGLCAPVASFAQYANDWINFGQDYYKVSIAEDGLYRLTYDDLQQAGLPIGFIDPRVIQLFHRGKEVAINFKHDQVPADAHFDPAEFFEFYGKRNDGTLDAKLYVPASTQPHAHYNLFSDSSAYFITWNSQLVQGKRMELVDQVNTTAIPKEPARVSEQLKVFFNEYSGGSTALEYIQQSFFDEGEGWTGATICTQNSDCLTDFRDFVLEGVINGVPAQGSPGLDLLLVGRDNLLHRAELYAGADAGSLRLITSVDFSNYETAHLAANLAWTDIGPDGKVTLRVKAVGVGGARERLSVSYLTLSFPRNFDMDSSPAQVFSLNEKASGKSYIELDDYAAGTRLFDISDPFNVKIIGTRSAGTSLSAVVPNTNTARKLTATSTFKSVDPEQVSRVVFRQLDDAAEFIVVSHRNLHKGAVGYANPVRAYAGYRASAEGGGYDTLTVTIDQLYDQFNYGEKSPLAIREFMRRMVGEGNPRYLFLIGKGREVAAGLFRRALAAGEQPNLIPTAGFPASDMIYTQGLAGETLVPAVPVGRLTATLSEHVAAYLNKVKEAEAEPFEDLWRKRILHLSGGIQPNELPLFRGYMKGFEDVAEDKYLGGNVLTLGKHSVSPIEFINISKEINAGVNLVTFFGHSSSTATDIDIGRVSDPVLGFNNTGKYPSFLVNGCNAGEFFNNGFNFGEDWMLAVNKGARNFIANSSFGLDGSLRIYTNLFYEVAFGDTLFINKGIGDVQQEVARRLLSGQSAGSILSAQSHQMVLLGDPSLTLFAPSRPDFETSDAMVTVSAYDGKPIHALTDSLQVEVITRNLGRATDKPLRLRVVHVIEDRANQFDTLFNSVLNVDTLRVTIRRDANSFFGSNRIDLALDPLLAIPELREDNNKASWVKSILFNGTQNLQPAPFGIVSSPEVDFVFQDTDLVAAQKAYVIEVDTSATFDSPWLKTKTLNARVLAKTRFTLLSQDSTVYYWRTRPTIPTDAQWETTSFAYISNGPTGWAQLDFGQLNQNTLSGLVPDAPKELFEFEKTSVSFFVKNFGSGNASSSVNGSFQVDNAEYYISPQGFSCRINTINLVAFDRSSAVPYLGIPFTFLNSFGRACGREPMLINSFLATETETGDSDDLIQYVDNIKEGDSVVLFSMGDAGFAQWSAAVKSKLESFGVRASDIDGFVPGEPVIIIGSKGAAPGTATIIRSDQPVPQDQELQSSDEFTGRKPSGSMKSVTIGPALAWKSVYMSTQVQASAATSVDVYGVRRDGKEILLIEDQEIDFSIDGISATTYPYLKLLYFTRDEMNLAPSVLDNWIVTYEPAPDGLIVMKSSSSQVVLEEGQTLNVDLGFLNISGIGFKDSLDVTYKIYNQQFRTSETRHLKIKGPAPGDTTSFKTSFATRSRKGLNDVSWYVNPVQVTEQYYQNNNLELAGYLRVQTDHINPTLDVTFDGRFLINGDYVSRSPLIKVTLRDSNPYLFPLDTTMVALFLTSPCTTATCPPKKVLLSKGDVTWEASSTAPELSITFKPVLLAAGEYAFEVHGFDASGNPGGAEPYLINFIVSDEASVVFVDAYPNPSSAGFFFEFLSTDNIPDHAVLQIFDRGGHLVASYDEADMPPFHVGTNQFYWNGLDERGVALADGIYFYRLMLSGAAIGESSTGKILIRN